MRRIPLLTVPLINPAGAVAGRAAYADMLMQLAKSPPGGVSVAETRGVVAQVEAAVGAAVERSQDFVLLEEADWVWLAARAPDMHWLFVSPTFGEFVDAVVGAEMIDPNRDIEIIRREVAD